MHKNSRPIAGRMDYSQYLRRKMEASTQIIAPRPIGDASQMVQIQRFKASAAQVKRGSDGQQQQWTSEAIVSAKAGCSICKQPAPTTTVVACCPPEPIPEQPNGAFPKAAAYVAKGSCCGVIGGVPHLADPWKCCK